MKFKWIIFDTALGITIITTQQLLHTHFRYTSATNFHPLDLDECQKPQVQSDINPLLLLIQEYQKVEKDIRIVFPYLFPNAPISNFKIIQELLHIGPDDTYPLKQITSWQSDDISQHTDTPSPLAKNLNVLKLLFQSDFNIHSINLLELACIFENEAVINYLLNANNPTYKVSFNALKISQLCHLKNIQKLLFKHHMRITPKDELSNWMSEHSSNFPFLNAIWRTIKSPASFAQHIGTHRGKLSIVVPLDQDVTQYLSLADLPHPTLCAIDTSIIRRNDKDTMHTFFSHQINITSILKIREFLSPKDDRNLQKALPSILETPLSPMRTGTPIRSSDQSLSSPSVYHYIFSKIFNIMMLVLTMYYALTSPTIWLSSVSFTCNSLLLYGSIHEARLHYSDTGTFLFNILFQNKMIKMLSPSLYLLIYIYLESYCWSLLFNLTILNLSPVLGVYFSQTLMENILYIISFALTSFYTPLVQVYQYFTNQNVIIRSEFYFINHFILDVLRYSNQSFQALWSNFKSSFDTNEKDLTILGSCSALSALCIQQPPYRLLLMVGCLAARSITQQNFFHSPTHKP